MKKIETLILMVLSIILIAGMFTALSAQKAQIRAMSLSDLIGSDDEIECFAQFFDVKPEILKPFINDKGQNVAGLLQEYKQYFENEVKEAGYSPYFQNHIYYIVPFDKDGNIINCNQFQNQKMNSPKTKVKIIGKHIEKTVFHYDVEE
jgi:hypothetical protein